MATTNTRGTRKTDRKGRRHQATGRVAAPEGPLSATAGASAEPRVRTERSPASLKVGGGLAARQLRRLADVSESLDTRRRLRRLGRLVARRAPDAQQVAFQENAVSECLDEAGAAAPREQWLLAEGATWALARLARSRRAGGSTGGLLERLVRLARPAQATLEAGDTLPAGFTLALSRLFRDIEACRCLERAAAEALAKEIGSLVSVDGALCLAGSEAVVERVNRWAAARALAAETGDPAWDERIDGIFSRSVAATLALLGDEGRLLTMAGRMPAAFTQPLLEAAGKGRRRLARTARRVAAARRARVGKAPRDAARKLLPRDLHDPAAAVAILRSGWDRDAIRVLVRYRDATPQIEIAVGDRLLCAGPWRFRVSLDGRPLEPRGAWRLSCWESDRRATFLEITASLEGGLELDRQVVLLPEDRVLLVADAVTTRTRPPATGSLRMEMLLPLAPALEAAPAEDTREIVFSDTRARLLAFPLGLPEWRAAGSGGLSATPDGLLLETKPAGGRCYAPIWLDLDSRRQGRPLTWRQLTVADTRRNLPPQQAVGYRVQSGREQWLVYQALDEARNRSVLGCNLSCDFLLGRIGRTGMVERTIEID